MSTHGSTTRQRASGGGSGGGSTKSAKSPAERRAELVAKVEAAREAVRVAEQEIVRTSRDAAHGHSNVPNMRALSRHERATDALSRAEAQLKAHDTRQANAGRDRTLDRLNAQVAKLEQRHAETARQLQEAKDAVAAHVAAKGRGETASTARPTRPASGGTSGRYARALAAHGALVPQRQMPTTEISVTRPLDPYFLHQLYGGRQLGMALSRYPAAKLQQGIDAVQARVGGKAPSARSRDKAIDYIVTHVAGPEYLITE